MVGSGWPKSQSGQEVGSAGQGTPISGARNTMRYDKPHPATARSNLVQSRSRVPRTRLKACNSSRNSPWQCNSAQIAVRNLPSTTIFTQMIFNLSTFEMMLFPRSTLKLRLGLDLAKSSFKFAFLNECNPTAGSMYVPIASENLILAQGLAEIILIPGSATDCVSRHVE